LKASKQELKLETSLSARMHSALHQFFGYTSFRPLQEEIIRDVLEKKDVFVLMPTGGGKSICYQLPALLMEGVTVVVSPLISLMKDQVDSLDANGIAAACMNSTQSARENRDVKTAFLENRLKILYIAPERLMMPGTFAFLKKGKVSLFAIDEAHCISEWGHDFRPEYRKLKLLRNPQTGLPGIPIIALTATATERVREDIVSQLGLGISPEKGPYMASFNRKNLYYEVRPKKETFSEITDYLLRHRGEAGIIYCQSRNSVEVVTKKLNLAGFKALPYHAGLSDTERTRNQELFIKDDVDIIVATIAFGMGIDKSNVRFVIHYDLPKNLESYYQETGRGGRDGGSCECILFFSRGDRFKYDYFISQKTDEREKDLSLVQLRKMVAYCEGNKCRRQAMIEYFGEKLPDFCGNCDSCLRPKGTFDGTEAAIKLITCIQELNQRFGTNYVIDVLTGSKNKKIKQNRHEKLKTHGSGREFTKEQWRSLVSEMTNTGLLEVSGAQYPVLKLNAMSRKILKGLERIELVCPEGFVPETGESLVPSMAVGTKDDRIKNDMELSTEGLLEGKLAAEKYPTEVFSAAADILKPSKVRTIVKSGKGHDPILFERLKALRKELALKKNLPPYIIFSDTTLKEMATKLPQSPEEFHSITGVGDHKLRKYGDTFLAEIGNYCRDYGLLSAEEEKIEGSFPDGKEPENDKIITKSIVRKDENSKLAADIEASGIEASGIEAPGIEAPVPESNKIEISEIHRLPAKRTRYLDMSIQDWSEKDSSAENFNEKVPIGSSPESEALGMLKTDPLEANSIEADPNGTTYAGISSIEPESHNVEPFEAKDLKVGSDPETDFNLKVDSNLKLDSKSDADSSLEINSLQRTYSLFNQGLEIDQIAEIQGLSMESVFRQFEKLILAGKIKDIEGLLPPQKEQQIKAALRILEPELDSLIRAKMGEGYKEEELKFVRALLLSKIGFFQS
jgi:ATP-dependent DNA helicase RecQ